MDALDTAAEQPAPPSHATIEPDPAWIERAASLGYDWAVVAWRRAAAVPGAWFDAAKADKVVESWPKWFQLTEDRFYKKPFRLLFWQELIVRLLVGWKMPMSVLADDHSGETIIDVRVFRSLRLWIPRKNGKSEFLAALFILFFVFEKIYGAQGFVFAKDEKQGKIPFAKIKTMVQLNPELAKSVQIFKKSIFVPEIGGTMELLPGRAEGKHGRSPTVTLGDEMHEWTTTALLDTLRQGTGARLQPIELTASTAGLRTNEIGYGLYNDSLAILDGRVDDASTLAVIFAAHPEDDPFDEATWPKANPSLGLSPTVAFLRGEATRARNNPRREAQFRCYHLNQWIDQEVRWLPLKIWDQGAPDREAWRTRWKDLKGRRCKLAFDVSATQDITGLVLRFEPEEVGESVKLICRAWIPEDTLSQREKNGREAWSKWIASGALETTPGNWVDQDYLKKAIEDALADFDVEQIGFDPWNARKLVSDLVKSGADEDLFVEMRQGILTLGEGSKQFETRVFNKSLDHGGHPLLRWMAGHCVIRFDENLNFMPSKKRSRDKIDLIVCAVMTEALSLVEVDTEVYADGRDMVVI